MTRKGLKDINKIFEEQKQPKLEQKDFEKEIRLQKQNQERAARMDRANKRDKMKEFNRLKLERKKTKRRKEGPGRPSKWTKTIESDEEETYFEFLVNEPENRIMVEMTPWKMSSHAEQGLEGMKDNFSVIEK